MVTKSSQMMFDFQSASTGPTEVVSADQVMEAWKWLQVEMNGRPNVQGGLYQFDRKQWRRGNSYGPLEPVTPFVDHIGALYFLTQFGDQQSVIALTNTDCGSSVDIYGGAIEEGLRLLIESEDRFRWALSEHLAFWVYLAVEAKQNSLRFIRTRPNIKPEKQGPDGVSIALYDEDASNAKIEIHSVKNSKGNPKQLIATAQFRKSGVGSNRHKLLDGFWFTSHNGDALIELDEQLESVSSQLGLSTPKKIRMALLGECMFNAEVVASDSFADAKLFDGYQYVVASTDRLIATYVGASNWKEFAKATQKWVIQQLQRYGVW